MSMRKMRYAAAMAALFAVAVWTTSCSTTPTQSEHHSVSLLERPNTGRPAAALEGTLDVNPAKGGTLTLGNEEIGYSTLTVPAGAVDNAVTLTMSLTTSGTVMAEFGPSPLYFNEAVEIALSFKGAELGGIALEDIKLFQIDVPEPLLVVPSGVPGEDLVVEGSVWHFSQYSPGSEE